MPSKRRNMQLAVTAMAFYLVVVVMLYMAESDADSGNIHSISDAVWYSIVTLTTVGYGDFYPVTLPGRIAGLLLVLGSLGVLSVLIGTLTDNFITMRESRHMGYGGTKFSNHIIVVGWDRFAEKVTAQLVTAHNRVCVITEHKENVDLIYEQFPRDWVFVLYAELHNQDVLDKVNIAEAKVLFPNLKDDARNLVYVINVRKKHPHLQIVMTLDNYDLQETFENAGVNYTISKNDVSSKMLASYIFEPDVARFNEDLLASASGRKDFDVQQYKILPKCSYAGMPYSQVFQDLKRRFNVVPIGLSKPAGETRVLHKLPADDMPVEVDDYVLLITSGLKVAELECLFQIKEGVF